jgi:predicted RNase H-like nuclease (RuvC/YqgF family)
MGWGLGKSCNDTIEYDKKIQQYKDSIRESKVKIEYLQKEQIKLEQIISEQYIKIESQKRQIVKLKKKLNEKVDSVRNLDNQQSLEYISEWLSKRGSN